VRRSFFLVICFAAAAGRAAENDLQLWRLGHPDPLGCHLCNGLPGDSPEAGDPNAQARFHRLASTLGLALVPPFQEPAGTLGQAGFEVGVSSSEAFLRIPGDAWPTSAAAPPRVLTVPAVTLRKGLGASFELGAAVSWLSNSQIMALSAELRWAVVDGFYYAPDIALRLWGTRALGTQELDLGEGGVDVQLSKSFGVAGMVKLQPYGQGGVVLINAQSAVVNFKPTASNPRDPTAQDGVFHTIAMVKSASSFPYFALPNAFLRGTVGLRLVAGVVVLGVEGGLAWGTNSIQSDPLPGGAVPPKNFVRLWSSSARLGFSF
jgi:hypothetical protein